MKKWKLSPEWKARIRKFCKLVVYSYGVCSVVLVIAWFMFPKFHERNLGLAHVAAMLMSVVVTGVEMLFPVRAGMSRNQFEVRWTLSFFLSYLTFTLFCGLFDVIELKPIPQITGCIVGFLLATIVRIRAEKSEQETINDINKWLNSNPFEDN